MLTRFPTSEALPDDREGLGEALRWAFPLPDGGSFTELLQAIEDSDPDEVCYAPVSQFA